MTADLEYLTENQVKALVAELNEWLSKWNDNQKALCDEFWDNCAQEWCVVPCSMVLEAEKERRGRQRD